MRRHKNMSVWNMPIIKYAILIVLAHIAITVEHGIAHQQLGVTTSSFQYSYVLVVTLACPNRAACDVTRQEYQVSTRRCFAPDRFNVQLTTFWSILPHAKLLGQIISSLSCMDSGVWPYLEGLLNEICK